MYYLYIAPSTTKGPVSKKRFWPFSRRLGKKFDTYSEEVESESGNRVLEIGPFVVSGALYMVMYVFFFVNDFVTCIRFFFLFVFYFVLVCLFYYNSVMRNISILFCILLHFRRQKEYLLIQ